MAKWHMTKDREEAYKNMINMWLAANPENQRECMEIIAQNRRRRKENYNEYGASSQHPDDLRIGVSLPPGLYYSLVHLERQHENKFMHTKQDLWWFARKFPQFCIMERI